MTKKSTKSKLISSLLVLALCLTMFVGSTYAWFSDEVVSGRNTIQSGNLDLKVSWKPYAEGTFKEVTDTEAIFDDYALYEPGYTEAIWLKIENAGSLAFKYDIALNVFEEKEGINKDGNAFKLSDYVKFKTSLPMTDYVGFESYYSTRESLNNYAFTEHDLGQIAEFQQDAVMLKGWDPQYILVVLNMPETVENEANHNGINVPELKLGLSAIATQMTVESDGFGTDYDKDAETTNPYEAVAKISELATEDMPSSVSVRNFTNWGNEIKTTTLDVGYEFKAADTAATVVDSPYRYWHADFVVTFSEDIPANAAGLAGSYESFMSGAWLGFEHNDVVPANNPIRLLYLVGDYAWTYEAICKEVGTFKCGAYSNDDAATKVTPGTTMTVELVLFEANEGENYVDDEGAGRKVVATRTYTF